MRKLYVFLLSAAIVAMAGAFACGGGEAPPESESALAVDHGAGAVLRVDPAFDAIVPADYKIEKLGDGMVFTEGPVWVREGGPYLLFSDVPGNTVYQWTPGGSVTPFLKPVFAGEREGGIGSNGLTLDSQGRLMICEHGNRRIARLKLPKEGERETVVDKYQGKRLNSPNDLVYKSDGWLYFTDPPYGLAKLEEDPERDLDFNGIFRLSPDEKTLELLNQDQTRPNGIGFSPDEKTLYVANSDNAKKLWMAYDVKDDDTLENGRVFYDVTSETAEGSPTGSSSTRTATFMAPVRGECGSSRPRASTWARFSPSRCRRMSPGATTARRSI